MPGGWPIPPPTPKFARPAPPSALLPASKRICVGLSSIFGATARFTGSATQVITLTPINAIVRRVRATQLRPQRRARRLPPPMPESPWARAMTYNASVNQVLATQEAEVENDVHMKRSTPRFPRQVDLFQGMPVLEPLRAKSPAPFEAPADIYTSTPPTYKSLTTPFPGLYPSHGIRSLPTPELSPASTASPSEQLQVELDTASSGSDSEASSTIPDTWQTRRSRTRQQERRRQRDTLKTNARGLSAENNRYISTTPSAPSIPRIPATPTPAIIVEGATAHNSPEMKELSNAVSNQVLLTPPLVRTRRPPSTKSSTPTSDKKMSRQSPAESDISSTCNVSPGEFTAAELATTQSQTTLVSANEAERHWSPEADTSESTVATPTQPLQETSWKSPQEMLEETTAQQQAVTPAQQLAKLSLADDEGFAPDTPTPKAGRHSSEKTTRITRAEQKRLDAQKESLQYEIAPLPAEWETKVRQAVRSGHGRYAASDLTRVVPLSSGYGTDNWLNDEVINGYLNLIVTHGKKNDRKEQVPSHHAFNSFFYTNLSTKGPDSVKKWATRAKIGGKKLLEVEKVFVPINSGMHWTLCVVQPKAKKITHYNSLSGNGSNYVQNVKRWVETELGSSFNEQEWTLEDRGPSPQQTNMDDCGVFTITSARQIMLGFTPMSYKSSQIQTQRKRIVAELINGELLKSEN